MININKNNIYNEKNNNKGFTLVELVVSFAILSVIALCISIMMTSGSNMFVRVNRNINLSYKSQIPMTQLKEYLVDCNGIYVGNPDSDGNQDFYVTGYDGEQFILHEFTYNKETMVLSLQDYTFYVYDDTNKKNMYMTPSKITEESQPLAKNVENFTISYNAANKIPSVTIDYTCIQDESRYSKTQVIALRNSPLLVENKGAYTTVIENLAAQIVDKI